MTDVCLPIFISAIIVKFESATAINSFCPLSLPPDVSSDVQLLFISVLSVVNIAGNLLVCGLILTNKNLREQVLKTQNKM